MSIITEHTFETALISEVVMGKIKVVSNLAEKKRNEKEKQKRNIATKR
ncbi:MAG: hypothetical protein ACK5C0_04105 [Candidatus Kapaibacterium sp.]|jgi:hypothetical protein